MSPTVITEVFAFSYQYSQDVLVVNTNQIQTSGQDPRIHTLKKLKANTER